MAEVAEFSVIGLAGKSALIEKGLLLWRRHAAKNAVSMRKAAEPADDVGMVLGVFQVLRPAGGAEELDATQLIGEVLRMHEWYIEEFEQLRLEAPVRAARDRAVCDLKRQRVA